MPDSQTSTDLLVRDATADDMPQIRDIYSHFVNHSLSTFEEEVPDLAEMMRRREAVQAPGLPYLVALQGEEIVGYAYVAPLRTRKAYRYTVENSIYVKDGFSGRGIGQTLMMALVEACEALGIRQMVAVISNTESGSIQLHKRCGFEHAGVLKAAGFKFGRWAETVYMQRAIGDGDSTPPKGPGNGT